MVPTRPRPAAAQPDIEVIKDCAMPIRCNDEIQFMSKRRHYKTNSRFREDPHNSPEETSSTPALPEEVADGSQPWQAVRPDKVERARKLVQDPNYPSIQILESIADLLAKRLDSGQR
jgi:hypothetical protein